MSNAPQKIKADAAWIRKTMRKNTLREFKKIVDGDKPRTNSAKKQNLVASPENISTLVDPKIDDASKMSANVGTSNQGSVKRMTNSEFQTTNFKKTSVPVVMPKKQPSLTEVKIDNHEKEEDEESEDEDESEEEEDSSELNEMNFNKLLQIRVQSTDYQLEEFCAKYVFTLKKEGVKECHLLADDFELSCKLIYEPMLRKNQMAKTKKRSTLQNKSLRPGALDTLRNGTLRARAEKDASLALNIPKEFPVEHELSHEFLETNGIVFKNEDERKMYFDGLHIMESCCFFQILLLKYRDMILQEYLSRWTKTMKDLEDEHKSKILGALVLEEFFMPPMKIEPKLDTELVKFSKLMSNRQFTINDYKKKMLAKEPNSVAYNVLKNELQKYIHELEEKIKISEIYFAAAIMKVKQKQEKELERIYEEIEADDRAENMEDDKNEDEDEEDEDSDSEEEEP